MNDAIFAPFKPPEAPLAEAKPEKTKRKTQKTAKPDPVQKAAPAEKPVRKPRTKKPATSSPMLKISLADMAVLSATLRPDDYEPFGAIYERLLALPAVTRARVLLAIQKAFA